MLFVIGYVVGSFVTGLAVFMADRFFGSLEEGGDNVG